MGKGKKSPLFEECASLLINRYYANLNQYESDEADDRPIVVVVLGAAASHPLVTTKWSEMKTPILERCRQEGGEFVIRELAEKLAYIVGTPKKDESVDEIIERLKKASVEEISNGIKAFSTLVPVIQDLIVDKFSPIKTTKKSDPPPLMAYEILAHLLNHGFIDHIISYNFDELLDHSITNELGDEKCELIISENQLMTSEQLTLEQRKDIPRVIKIHGSTSSKSTLRFALDDTCALTFSMREYLDRLIFPNNNRQLSIISYGYSWEDKNLLDWLNSREDKVDNIYISKFTNKIPSLFDESFKNSNNRVGDYSSSLKEKVSILSTEEIFSECGSHLELCTVGELLAATWGYVADTLDNDKNSFSFQSASRHLVSARLFSLKSQKGELVVPHSNNNRIKLEIYLHILKCNGMINVPALSGNHRVQPYYEKFSNGEDKYEGSKKSILDDDFSFMKKDRDDDLREVYFADQGDSAGLIDQFFEVMPVEDSQSFCIFEYKKETSKILLSEDKPPVEYFREHLKKIYQSSEVEISAQTDPRDLWLFYNSKPLTSQLVLKEQSRALLDEKWTHLLAIAETGEWLYREMNLEKFNNCWIGLIKACIDDPELWPIGKKIQESLRKEKEGLSNNIRINEAEMIWHSHNRHLTLAINNDDKTVTDLKSMLRGGIFFRRYGRAKSICPVWLSDPEDLLELFITYLTYFWRSLNSGRCSNVNMKEHFDELQSIACKLVGMLEGQSCTIRNAEDYIGRVLGTIEKISCYFSDKQKN